MYQNIQFFTTGKISVCTPTLQDKLNKQRKSQTRETTVKSLLYTDFHTKEQYSWNVTTIRSILVACRFLIILQTAHISNIDTSHMHTAGKDSTVQNGSCCSLLTKYRERLKQKYASQ